MRTSECTDVTLCLYVDDTEEGTVVMCGNCKHETASLVNKEDKSFCPCCEHELFYRPWWEW